MVTEMTDLERIKELVSILNKAGKSYYSEGVEIMSNFEYDKLYDELVKLEEKLRLFFRTALLLMLDMKRSVSFQRKDMTVLC